MATNFFKKLKNDFLDLIFPRFCVGCGLEGAWLCNKCKKDIIEVLAQICPDCGRLSQNGRYCPRCRKGKSLKGIIVAAYYEEGAIREVVHNFKYNSVTELSDILARLLINAYKKANLKIDLITFAPLHPKRLAQRGYNQAEILAQKLSLKTGTELKNLLKKTRSTKRQVEMSGKNRRKNLIGAFVLNGKQNIKNKKILIVDDITTTGATLNECALVLKNKGAKEIWGLVVARG